MTLLYIFVAQAETADPVTGFSRQHQWICAIRKNELTQRMDFKVDFALLLGSVWMN
jgi:hypothetical protein